MSVDRVIVGGGHFIMRGGQLVQEFASRAPNMIEAFNRAQERLTYHSNVQVAQRSYHALPNNSGARYILCESDGNDNNWSPPDRDGMGGGDRAETARERAERFRQEQWDKTLELGSEIGQAYGYGLAGDLQGAYDHTAEAAAKAGELILDKLDYLFGGGS